MAIQAKRRNEGRRLTAALLNALAIGGVATAVFAPFDGSGVGMATRAAYLVLAVYMHLCAQTAIGRIEEES